MMLEQLKKFLPQKKETTFDDLLKAFEMSLKDSNYTLRDLHMSNLPEGASGWIVPFQDGQKSLAYFGSIGEDAYYITNFLGEIPEKDLLAFYRFCLEANNGMILYFVVVHNRSVFLKYRNYISMTNPEDFMQQLYLASDMGKYFKEYLDKYKFVIQNEPFADS
jgi:hypothetical protein